MPDTDIGQCDHCGTEAGPRTPTRRTVTIGGWPATVTAWLCPSCTTCGCGCHDAVQPGLIPCPRCA